MKNIIIGVTIGLLFSCGVAAAILGFQKSMVTKSPTIQEESQPVIPQATSTPPASVLKFPLDPTDQKVLDRAVADSIDRNLFDTVWRRLFHYLTSFESLTGFATSVSGGSSVVATSDRVTLTTAATLNNTAELSKGYLNFGLASFNQKSNFRTAFSFNATPSKVNAYFIVGTLATTSTTYYGFKVVDTTLYGVSSNNGSNNEQTVVLLTGLTSDIFNIEARYIPGDSVTFITSSITQSVARGTLRTGLPKPYVGGVPVVNSNILDIFLKTTDGNAKSMSVSFFEYLQYRNTLR